jgi:hypothetical protein
LDSSSLIDQLIDTYHVLNTNVRSLPGDRFQTKTTSGESIEDIVRTMRDHELQFSQALKQRVTGVAMPDIFGKDAPPVIGAEAKNETTPILIAQFGSAREVTLSQLRGLPEPDWDVADSGGRSIRASVTELVENNQRQLTKIASQLGAAAPA